MWTTDGYREVANVLFQVLPTMGSIVVVFLFFYFESYRNENALLGEATLTDQTMDRHIALRRERVLLKALAVSTASMLVCPPWILVLYLLADFDPRSAAITLAFLAALAVMVVAVPLMRVLRWPEPERPGS